MSCPFTQCSNYNTCPVVNLEFPITQCGVYTARSFCPTLTNAQFPDEVALLSDNATFMRLYREVRIRFDTAPKNYQKQDYQRLLELFRFLDGVDSSFEKTEITTLIGLNAAIDPGAYSVVLPSIETTLGVTTFSMIVLPQDDDTLQIAYFINADGEAKMYERLITNGTPLVLGPWVDSDAHLIHKVLNAEGKIPMFDVNGNLVVSSISSDSSGNISVTGDIKGVNLAKIHYVNKASGNGIYEKFAVEDSVVYVDLVPNLLEGFDPKTFVGLVSFCIEDFTSPVTGNEQIRFRWTNNDSTISTVRIYLSTGGYMPTNTPSIISDVFSKQVIVLFAFNEGGKGSCLIGTERSNTNIAFQGNTTETIDPYLETEHIYEVSDDTKENVIIFSSGVGSSITFPLTLTTDKAIYITVSDGSEELLIGGLSAIQGDVFSATFILSSLIWTINKLTPANITDFSDVTVKQCNSNPNDELHLLENTTVIYGLNMPLGSIVHAVGDLLLITNRADNTHQGLFEVLGYLGSYVTHTMHVIRKIASAEQLNIVRVSEGINKGVWQSLYDGSNEGSIRFIKLDALDENIATSDDFEDGIDNSKRITVANATEIINTLETIGSKTVVEKFAEVIDRVIILEEHDERNILHLTTTTSGAEKKILLTPLDEHWFWSNICSFDFTIILYQTNGAYGDSSVRKGKGLCRFGNVSYTSDFSNSIAGLETNMQSSDTTFGVCFKIEDMDEYQPTISVYGKEGYELEWHVYIYNMTPNF